MYSYTLPFATTEFGRLPKKQKFICFTRSMNAQPEKVTAGSKSCAFKQTIVNQLIINHAFIDTNELFSRGGTAR